MTPERWRRVTEVFHVARSHEPAARAQYLDHVCAADRALRDEVDAMLAAHSGAGQFGESPVNVSIYRVRQLNAGAQVGSYRIDALIGAGGMGEVYRAHDSTLHRDVALKILPAAFAADPDRLARFAREARALAALNHPNIATIYGLEDQDGIHALVMELVEGETLAERLERITRHQSQGPSHKGVSIEEALVIAQQMADALEAAHEKGIVHRDLKPANIKITPAGVVKVLDFGLAKVALDGAESQAPPATIGDTREGVILGTAAYMSPEQACGRFIDKRTDIWAFGCVLYEMLTGRRAFGGEEVTVTLACVLEREPDFGALSPLVPARVHQALRLCLRKDPKQRAADIRDVRLVLEGAFETAAVRAVQDEADVARPLWRRALPWAAGIVLGGLLVSTANRTLTPPATRPVARLEVTTAPTAPFVGSQLGSGGTQSLAVSPDGTRIVYRTRVEGRTHLYVRRVDQLAGTSLFTDQNLDTPVISPDGAWVVFHAGDGTWKKVAMLGGPAVTLAPTFAAVAHGAAWCLGDTVIVGGSVGGSPGLWRVPAAGGKPTVVTTKDATRGEIGHWWPEVLPGGRAVLFTIVRGESFDTMEIAVLDLTTGEHRTLLPGGSRPRYAVSGHLIYGVNGRLMAVPFNPDRLELAGSAVPVVEGVLADPLVGLVEFDLSADGSLVYVAGANFGETQSLVWVDREGREEVINAPNRGYSSPRISPDGTKVAFNLRDEENDIWSWDFARETLTRLTFDPGLDRYPVWSPDGRRIAFSSTRDKSRGNLFWQTADGTGTVERVAESDDLQVFPTAFSLDGTRLLVTLASGSRDGADIAVVQPGGEARAVPLLATTFGERNGEVSPNGRWLAYNSNESGRDEVYVRPFPDVDTGRWQVSTAGGSQPLWARNGRELFFRSNAALMAVQVRTDQSFTAGNPAVVFEGSYATPQGGRTYDVSPDGQRFLMIKEGAAADPASRAQIILVQNFFEELKRLVPAQKANR